MVTHSKLLNDFLSFYIETSIDGEKRYGSVVDYLNKVICISDLSTSAEYDFQLTFEDETEVEDLIKSEVENIIKKKLNGSKHI